MLLFRRPKLKIRSYLILSTFLIAMKETQELCHPEEGTTEGARSSANTRWTE
ncbi:hypothetical protein [Desulfosporosinus sp.]|uniref:hypothetical protein n=1 Tax=Desulfosporosinus sp. TaxID=157907 RepID=UPI0025B9DB68|nr:hypothetical protein [Desulfosporosinus sp.]MBC2727920.1 hypothetical protein [Desulfosporosinus sp.]